MLILKLSVTQTVNAMIAALLFFWPLAALAGGPSKADTKAAARACYMYLNGQSPDAVLASAGFKTTRVFKNRGTQYFKGKVNFFDVSIGAFHKRNDPNKKKSCYITWVGDQFKRIDAVLAFEGEFKSRGFELRPKSENSNKPACSSTKMSCNGRFVSARTSYKFSVSAPTMANSEVLVKAYK